MVKHDDAVKRAETLLASGVLRAPRPLAGVHCLVVEDESVLAHLEKRLLRAAGAIAASVETLAEAREALAHPWDLLLVDVKLGEDNGLDLARKARLLSPAPAILVVTGFPELVHSRQLRDLGAQLVTKTNLSGSLVSLACAALDLPSPWSLAAAATDPADLQSHFAELAKQKRLTRRERDTVSALLAGKSSKVLAAELGLSAATVRSRARTVYQKLGVGNLRQLFALLTSPASIAER